MGTLNMCQRQIILTGEEATGFSVGVDYEVRNYELLKQMALQMFPLSLWQTLSPLKHGDASWA